MNNKKYILKTCLLALIFSVVLSFSMDYFKEDNIASGNRENTKIYKKSDSLVIANIGVAITTNIGTKHKQMSELPIAIYNDVLDISYILANKQVARDKIVSNNMILLNEYLNILKTDIKAMMSQSYDREQTIEVFIDQLKYRYEVGISNIATLKSQSEILKGTINNVNTRLEAIKAKIGHDFQNFDSFETIENINDYLKLKEEYTYARTYLVFTGKFVQYYSFLNNYNKKLLDTLINNKQAIIKDAYLVLPDTGTEILKKLNILYSEEEWKSGK